VQTTGGTPDNVLVAINNLSNSQIYSGYTDSLGKIPRQILTEGIISSASWAYNTPHSVTLSKEGSSKTENVIMDSTKQVTIALPLCIDADGDGFNVTGGTCGLVDCNDNNPLIYPGSAEVCNGLDDDCDGQVDEGNVCCINQINLVSGYSNSNIVCSGNSCIVQKDLIFCNTSQYGINIMADNLALDCNGYSIDGTGTMIGGSSIGGIYAENRKNITVKNCKVNNFRNGIYFWVQNGQLINNIVNKNTVAKQNFYSGIQLTTSSNMTVINCNVEIASPEDGKRAISIASSSNITIINSTGIARGSSFGNGIWLYQTSNSTIIDSNFTAYGAYGTAGIKIDGTGSLNNQIINCDGYSTGADSKGAISIDGAKYTRIINSRGTTNGTSESVGLRVTGTNNQIINSSFKSTNSWMSAYFYNANNNEIIDCDVSTKSFSFTSSSNNKIINLKMSNQINLQTSNNNQIINANVNYSGGVGVYLSSSSNNIIAGSTFNTGYGVQIIESTNTTISNNIINARYDGIILNSATKSIIKFNNINSSKGFRLIGATTANQTVYYNNINTATATQVYNESNAQASLSTWDDGNCAGNYWTVNNVRSDYALDRYPLAYPWNSPLNGNKADMNNNGLADCNECTVTQKNSCD
jgi:parallel beta-helix repeat protein